MIWMCVIIAILAVVLSIVMPPIDWAEAERLQNPSYRKLKELL